jgi:formylglycine-generating enzyme required for sulfatase activity
MPDLAHIEINRVSDRRAMDLPERYTRSCFDDIGVEVAGLRAEPVEALLDVLRDALEPLRRRFAAGLLLALLGDPRLDSAAPEMVEIPGARVRVGLPREEVSKVVGRYASYGVLREWIAKECPRHEVEVRPFRIARYPVTNQQYRRFLEATAHPELPTAWPLGSYPAWRANHPVYTVTASAADAYAAWLARSTGRAFRLPSEAEWEYAAAGAQGREFPWGDSFATECANTVELGARITTPVGMFPRGRSAFGVEEMGGNVEEYVADAYRPYPGAAVIADDLLLRDGSYRVARGGSFARFADLARCKRRHGFFHRPIYAMGFRLAEDAA